MDLGSVKRSGGSLSGGLEELERGKGGEVYLPRSDNVVRRYDEVVGLSSRAEIQSVRVASGGVDLVGGSGSGSGDKVLVTDTYGRGVCGRIEAGVPGRGFEVTHVYPLAPDDALAVAE